MRERDEIFFRHTDKIIISQFWDRPVPIFSDVRFSYLALVQDKKKSRAFYRQMHAVQFMSTAPRIIHAFPF